MSLIGFAHTMLSMGRNQTPEPEPPIGGVKMKKILSLFLDKNEVDRIASVLKMNYPKWELSETGGLDLYIEDWFSSQEDVYRS
jgi:hypothetical protein